MKKKIHASTDVEANEVLKINEVLGCNKRYWGYFDDTFSWVEVKGFKHLDLFGAMLVFLSKSLYLNLFLSSLELIVMMGDINVEILDHRNC